MDNTRRHLLQVHRHSIVQDLDVTHIIDSLISSQALRPDDFTFVLNLSKRPDQVAALLDLLPRNGNAAYEAFVSCLKKDYDWLWEKLQVGENSVPRDDIIKDAFEDGLSRGDVPRLPIHYVQRLELENKIKEQLIALKRHQVLVLHGMPGSGKSSLAVSILRSDPSLIVNTFSGSVFWINVGDCFTDEQIVSLQARIHKKIFTSESFRDGNSIDAISEMSMTSSMQSINLDDHDWTDYKDRLKCSFEDINFRESLLIIDDLRLEKVAEAFDVGCKILVTTQDVTSIKKFHPIITHITDSLTEQESLQLMASCISQDVKKLPSHAKKLHHICKGAPLLMAMLGGLLADNKLRLLHDEDAWKYYIKQLKNKDSFFTSILKSHPEQTSKPYLAIEMCIKSLNDKEIIRIYQSLAVLPNNVKVSTKALSVILDMDEMNVDTTMKRLKNKSLVIEHFDIDLKTYQYEIHDLIMSYLKSIHNDDEMKRLHASLILRYKDICLDKSLVNLPNDGYIAYYIGYHLYHTHNIDNMWDIFYSLYTNILFIGNKIRLAGPADVAQDIQKYTQIIVKKASDNEFNNELIKFINSHGHDLHRYPNTEIIQSIFQHNQDGILFQKALELATDADHKNNVYFQFQSEDNTEDTNYVPLDVTDTICVIKFWSDYILVGNADGNITLWNVLINKKIKTFQGHFGAIKTIALNNMKPFKMATTSEDGSLKIWNIDDCQDSNGYDELDSMEPDEPIHYNSFESISTLIHNQGPFCGCSWGHESDIVLAHTNPGSALVLYNTEGVKMREVRRGEDSHVTCSTLSVDDSLMICGYQRVIDNVQKYDIYLYNVKSGDMILSFTEHAPVLMLTVTPDQPKSILVLTTIHLHRHKWNHGGAVSLSQAKSNISRTNIADIAGLQNDYTFQTGCVSPDGQYAFVSTTDCRILVYSLKSNSMVSELNNHRGVVTSIDSLGYWDHSDDVYLYNLITKSGEDIHIVKLWYLLSSQLSSPNEKNRKSKLSLKFDCVFDKRLLHSPVISDFYYTDHNASPVKRTETLGRTIENSPKVIVQKSISLDRHSLRPLNLKNGSTGNLSFPCQPLIAVIDKNSKIQVLKNKKIIIETPVSKINITTVALSPCGQYLAYGLKSGVVNIFILKTRFTKKIMDLNDDVHYLEFLNVTMLIAAGRNSGLMIYEIMNSDEGDSIAKMIIRSGVELGSQELINEYNGKRRPRPDSNEMIKKSSPTSISSLSAIDSATNNSHRTYPHVEHPTLLKTLTVVKCFWWDDIGLLTIFTDASVKIWSLEPQFLGVVLSRQTNFIVSCVSLLKNSSLILCDLYGKFQIYNLICKTDNCPLSAILHDSNKIVGNISSCTVSNDGKVLAMGLENGDIVLWHMVSKSLITTLSLHKTKVRCLKFSPGPLVSPEAAPSSPFSPKTFNFPPSVMTSTSPKNSREDLIKNETPMVLVSLAGQIVWWNISYILVNNKTQLKRRSKGGSALHILSPRSSSMGDFNSFAETDLATSILKSGSKLNDSSVYFNYPDSQWEALWKGKSHKKNGIQKELLACIKLVGDEAENLMVDDKFSKFVTIDQSGNLYIMNVLENNVNIRTKL